MSAIGSVFGGMLRAVFTNERLFLMGLTSLALSLASGWTTFEGMTNFTRSPVLCFLITFGVQGIMLVSAWMIGEAVIALRAKRDERQAGSRTAKLFHTVFEGPATLFKVWLIWMVFLFSMAISVFFSFDSLFSAIFSDEERQRAGEIRAQSEVGAVLADLKTRIEKRKFEAIDTLLSAESWGAYNERLDRLSKIARGAPDLVEAQLLSKLRNEQAEISRHQETLAQAKGQRAALETRQQKIAADINRLKADRPSLSAEVEGLREQLTTKQREIDKTTAEALEEARGIGATGREGEGPKFRAIKEKERRLKAERDVLVTQKNLASTRLEKLDSQISTLARELELVNGEMAKIDGKASVAKTFIDAQAKRQSETANREFSATASIDSLDDARETFRNKTSKETFQAIQSNCTNLYSALSQVPKIAPDIKTISCEPGAATATLAARIFTLQAAEANQQENCIIGKGRRSTRIDPLLKLGKRCIQSSGLPEKDANELRIILNRVDLNRDDKAKNFVVTLNAFKDGNWLAYLALGLAIAIDSLVFISGLIGAKTAAYENTGNKKEVMRYGLGMTTEPTGAEPEDIFTAKIFFRAIEGPSSEPGYLAMIDRAGLRHEQRLHVNKVLTIAGDNIKQDAHNHDKFHIEETFYQNLARQVYLWDKFNNKGAKNRPALAKSGVNKNKDKKSQSPNFTFGSHSQVSKVGTIRKVSDHKKSHLLRQQVETKQPNVVPNPPPIKALEEQQETNTPTEDHPVNKGTVRNLKKLVSENFSSSKKQKATRPRPESEDEAG